MATSPSTILQQWTCRVWDTPGRGKAQEGRVWQSQTGGFSSSGAMAQPSYSNPLPVMYPKTGTQGEGRDHRTGTSHHHHTMSTHIQALVPRHAEKSGGESEAHIGQAVAREPCPAPRQPGLLLTQPGMEGRC